MSHRVSKQWFSNQLNDYSPGFTERHGRLIQAFDKVFDFDPNTQDPVSQVMLCVDFSDLSRGVKATKKDRDVIQMMDLTVKDALKKLPLSDYDRSLVKDSYQTAKNICDNLKNNHEIS